MCQCLCGWGQVVGGRGRAAGGPGVGLMGRKVEAWGRCAGAGLRPPGLNGKKQGCVQPCFQAVSASGQEGRGGDAGPWTPGIGTWRGDWGRPRMWQEAIGERGRRDSLKAHYGLNRNARVLSGGLRKPSRHLKRWPSPGSCHGMWEVRV